MYQYGVLRVDESAEARMHNDALLGKSTLGIEVTVSPLALQCGLGNLDPQHSGKSESSAIEEALEIPLPPDGTRLVTIRPDKDSFGAMAVLALRLEDKPVDVELVSWIGVIDRMGLDNARGLQPELAKSMREKTDAIQVVVMSADPKWQSIENKVREVARILSGEMPDAEIRAIAGSKERNPENFEVEMYGAVAFILAPRKYNRARDWGNRRYPLVVVCDPEYLGSGRTLYMRWSVVRRPETFDRRAFEAKINAAEAEARGVSAHELVDQGNAWGGPENIVSSPQGRGSWLSKEAILAIVQECAETVAGR